MIITVIMGVAALAVGLVLLREAARYPIRPISAHLGEAASFVFDYGFIYAMALLFVVLGLLALLPLIGGALS